MGLCGVSLTILDDLRNARRSRLRNQRERRSSGHTSGRLDDRLSGGRGGNWGSSGSSWRVDGGTSGSGWELGLDERAKRTRLLRQGLEMWSSLLVGKSSVLRGLVLDNLGVLSHSSINFLLVGLVERREREGQQHSHDQKGVHGKPRGELVEDVRHTGSLQSGLNVLSKSYLVDVSLKSTSNIANSRQNLLSEGLRVGLWSVTKVLGDETLARQQLAGVLGSSGNQKANVQSMEHEGCNIDFEQDESTNEGTKHLTGGDWILPGEQSTWRDRGDWGGARGGALGGSKAVGRDRRDSGVRIRRHC